jgi:uncharacterized membrane protein YfcA
MTFVLDTEDYYLGIVMFIFSIYIPLAGGGGGPISIALIMLFKGYSVTESIPIAMTAGCMIGLTGFLYNLNRGLNNKSLIDYDLLLAIAPTLANYTFIGLILNVIFPGWIIIMLVLIVFFIIIIKTVKKIKTINMNNDTDLHLEPVTKFNYCIKNIIQKILLLIVIFGILIVFSYYREQFDHCSSYYWGVYIGQFIIISIITAIIFYCLKNKHISISNIYIISLITGISSTFLGFGGAVLIAPYMTNLSYDPRSVIATNMGIVILTTLTGIIQFSIAGKMNIEYSLYLSAIAIVGSLIGHTLTKKLNIKKKYYIWLLISSLILNVLLMLIVGIRDLLSNDNHSFTNFC